MHFGASGPAPLSVVVMPSTIAGLIDQSLADWESKRLNCIPGAVPEAMRTGEVQDDWKYWRAINSVSVSCWTPLPRRLAPASFGSTK